MNDLPGNDEPTSLGPMTFEELHESHNRMITKYVARRVWHREDSLEIVSKVWEATWIRFQKQPPPTKWQTFIWGVVRNKVADWGRLRNRQPDPLYMQSHELERISNEVLEEPDVAKAVELRAMRGALYKALNRDLTDLQRTAVILRFMDNLPYSEIANYMKVSYSVAKKHVERGIVCARRSMARAGFLAPSKEDK